MYLGEFGRRCVVAVPKGSATRGHGSGRKDMAEKYRCLIIVRKKFPMKDRGFFRDIDAEVWNLFIDDQGNRYFDPSSLTPQVAMWVQPNKWGRKTLKFQFEGKKYSLPRLGAWVCNNPYQVSFFDFENMIVDELGKVRHLTEDEEDEDIRNRFWEADHKGGDPSKVMWDDLELVPHDENERRETERRAKEKKRRAHEQRRLR